LKVKLELWFGKAGFGAQEAPAEGVEGAVGVVKGFVNDQIPSADEFNNAWVVAFLEAGETLAFFPAPEIKDTKAQLFAETNRFPHHEVVGHDIFVSVGGGAVGVIQESFIGE